MKTMFAVVLATVFLAFVSASPQCPPTSEDVVLLPNPDDCASYYSCDGGVAYLMNCTAGLLFNPELRVCDWADNVTCSVAPTSSAAPSAEPSAAPSAEPVEEPNEKPSEESSGKPSEELDEDINKAPNAEPCEANSESSESSEESNELPAYK